MNDGTQTVTAIFLTACSTLCPAGQTIAIETNRDESVGLGEAITEVPQEVVSWLIRETTRAIDSPLMLVWRSESSLTNVPERGDGAAKSFLQTTLYWATDRLWRVLDDEFVATKRTRYFDHARADDMVWKLTPDWFVILDPKKPDPKGHPVRQVFARTRQVTQALLRADLQVLARSTLSNIHLDGNEIVATFNGERDAIVRFAWSPDLRRGFVNKLSLIQSGTVVDFSPWIRLQESDDWVASAFTVTTTDRRRRVTLVEARVVDGAAVRDVAGAPGWPGDDKLRGPITAWSFSDYRTEPVMEAWLDAGEIKRESRAVMETVLNRPRARLRHAGWWLAGAICSFVLFLRIRHVQVTSSY